VREVQPSGVVAHTDARAVGHVAHLQDRARTAELVADLAVEGDALHSRGVPRHVGDVPRLPHQRRAARRDVGIEHEVGRPVVEPLWRTVADERPPPHFSLVDDGDHERGVVAHDRRLDGVPLSDIRHAARSPARNGLQPEIAVAGGVDDRARIRHPGEASTPESAPDRGLRRRREDPFGSAGEWQRDDRRRRLPPHRERHGDTVRRRPRLGQITPGEAHVDGDHEVAMLRIWHRCIWGSRETSLERPDTMRHARCELSDPSRKERPMRMTPLTCGMPAFGSRARVVDVIAV
jgi:hypothetical protein